MRSRKNRRSVWKTILYMVGMGVACAWAAALAYPVAVRFHVSPPIAARLPNYATFIGLALGLGIGLSRSMKEVFSALFAMAILGSVFWLGGVFLEGLLIAVGAPPGIVSWVSPIAFGLGVLLGSVVLLVIVHDRVEARRLQ